MRMTPTLACAWIATGVAAQAFEAPFRIKAQDGWVDTDVGHAAPYLYDFDGDGKRDLLVGQFGEGKLRIYRLVRVLARPLVAGLLYNAILIATHAPLTVDAFRSNQLGSFVLDKAKQPALQNDEDWRAQYQLD